MGRRIQGPSVSFFAFQDIITSVVGIFALITIIMMVELVSKTVDGKSKGNQVADTLSATLNSSENDVALLRQRSEELSVDSRSVVGIQRFNVEEIRSDIEKRIQHIVEQTKRTDALNQQLRQVLIASQGELDQLDKKAVATEDKRDELQTLLGKLQYLESKIGNLVTEDPLVFRNTNLAGRSLIVADVQSQQILVLELARDLRHVFSGNDRLSKFETWVSKQSLDTLHFLLLIRPGAASSFSSMQEHLDSVDASFGFDVMGENRSIQLRSEARN